jgi:IclR family acetate operon transcriptional repressor
LPLTRIASHAGLSKSSTHRQLQTLIDEGYVVQDGDSRYRLGLKMLWLASDLVDGLGLERIVRPVLDEMARATYETVHMALLDGKVAVYVEKVDASNPIRRMYSRVGKRVPFHCTGLGKAILAYLPTECVREIIAAEGLPRYTANTITDQDGLLAHLALIRTQGYALDDEEHEEGVRCIAAPLFDRQQHVLGAVSIAALSHRVDRRRLLSWRTLLRASCEKVNVILRHQGLGTACAER